MAVETETTFNGPYNANGVTTVFPFTFVAASADELRVISRDAGGAETVVDGAAYAVTLAEPGGGNVTFGVAPASGRTVFILPVLTGSHTRERVTARSALEIMSGCVDESITRLSEVMRYEQMAPRVPMFESAAGRWHTTPAGNWICDDVGGADRYYFDFAGVFRGFLIEADTDTYHSADFNTTGSPSSGDDRYWNTSGTVNITYAGAHSEPDRFGNTGGCALINWESANASAFLPNTSLSLNSGDWVRLTAIVHILPPGTGTSFSLRVTAGSGTVPAGNVTVAVDATGMITAATMSGSVEAAERYGGS